MRSLAERRAEVDRADVAVRADPARASNIVALQRSAGNAAVARMLQRQLDVTDAEGPTRRFKSSAEASTYLAGEYRTKYHRVPRGEEQTRLDALAKRANLKNDIFFMKLEEALSHIKTGTPSHPWLRGYEDPSKSPEREPEPTAADYAMAEDKVPPTYHEAPGSPRHHSYPEPGIDINADTEALFGSIETKRADWKVETKKNMFAYSLRAVWRVEKLEELADGTWREVGQSSPHEAKVDSSIHHSSIYLLPDTKPKTKSQKGPTIEPEMRTQLDHLSGRAKAYPKSKDTAFAKHSAGTFTKKTAEGKYEMAGMAQPYAHSETAADTQVKTEAPRMADQLLQKMIASVPKANRPAMIVVHKVDWVGASAPNTVCAGACKHALMDITDEVVTAVTESRHSNKARLKDEDIHIRGSQKLTTSGHVRGDQKYPQGFGNIGGKPLGSGAAQHKRVLEYPPRKEPADKPEKKPAKRPRKDPSDEPRKKPRLEIDD